MFIALVLIIVALWSLLCLGLAALCKLGAIWPKDGASPVKMRQVRELHPALPYEIAARDAIKARYGTFQMPDVGDVEGWRLFSEWNNAYRVRHEYEPVPAPSAAPMPPNDATWWPSKPAPTRSVARLF